MVAILYSYSLETRVMLVWLQAKNVTLETLELVTEYGTGGGEMHWKLVDQSRDLTPESNTLFTF